MSQPTEFSLDPENWGEFRNMGHQMLDDMMDYLQNIRNSTIWQPIPEQVKKSLDQSLPLDKGNYEQIYDEFKSNIFPYPLGNPHPRFWGWVIGNGTPYGVLAEMLAATMNPNQGGGEHSANYVELQVIDWLKKMFKFPTEASGILVSGGSMANLVGLTVGRNTKIPDLRELGLVAVGNQYTIYASKETHSSNIKAVELLGIGRNNLREIAVNSEFQVNIDDLIQQVETDKKNGMIPLCIIGNAGTVNTGAFDDLEALADIAEKENMWFHVDGAFGSLVTISDMYRHLIKGIKKADSIAFDLHKWMYMQYEVGVALVRSNKHHYDTFTLTPDYLTHDERGTSGAKHWFSDYGIQLSRGFRALKVWMSLKAHGIRTYSKLIEMNIEQAKYLTKLIDENDELELLAPTSLNIVCFRYKGNMSDEDEINKFNQELLLQIQENAIAVPSSTILNSRFAIRVANTNYRTRNEDLLYFLREVVRLGGQLENRV